MMATTHALWGMVLGLPFLAVAPELAPFAMVAGLIGGIFPDLDLYAGHRKTLHFPYISSFAAVPAFALAVSVPGPITVIIGVGIAAAALHALSDIFGGGLELRPWEGTSDQGVYSHLHDRWLPPRRTIRYDGSPEDLMLAGVAALPLMLIGHELVSVLAAGLLAVSVVYVLLRRRLADVATFIASLVPDTFSPYVPPRYRAP